MLEGDDRQTFKHFFEMGLTEDDKNINRLAKYIGLCKTDIKK